MSNNKEPDQQSTDKTLINKIRLGSEDAATEIYIRYAKRLEALANSQSTNRKRLEMDSEGIVQSVFRTFFRRVEAGQYDVDGPDGLWKLLLVIALNKIRNKATFFSAKKRDVRRNVPLDSVAETVQPMSGEESQALAILQWTIDDLLQDFPDITRQVVLLRIEGCEVAEIASQLGRSKRTVERNLQSFRASLSQQLKVNE